MAVLSVNNSGRNSPFKPTATPTATTGDTFLNTGNEMVVIYNGTGGSMTVTMDVQYSKDGQTLPDSTASLGIGELGIFGPFPTNIYNDTGGFVKVTCSAVTSSLIGVFQKGSL